MISVIEWGELDDFEEKAWESLNMVILRRIEAIFVVKIFLR